MKKYAKTIKRFVAMMLSVVMVISFFPNGALRAFAEELAGTGDKIVLDFVPENGVPEVEGMSSVTGTIRNDSIVLYKSTDYGAAGVEVSGVQGVNVTVLTSHTIDNVKMYKIDCTEEANEEIYGLVLDYSFVSSTDIMLEGEESLPAPTPYPAIIPSSVINAAYNDLLATTTSAEYDGKYAEISADIINRFSAEQKAAVELHKAVLVAYETLMATETVASYDSVYTTCDPVVLDAFTDAQKAAISAHRAEMYDAENPDTGIYLELPEGEIAQAGTPSGALAAINGTSVIAYKSLDNGAMGVEIPVSEGTVVELITSYTFSNSDRVFYRYDYSGSNEELKEAATGETYGYAFIPATSVTITNEVGTNSYTDEEYGIIVSGQIPTGLTLDVAPEDADATLNSAGALMGAGNWTYDVELTYSGGEYKITQGIDVTFEKENVQFPIGANYKAYHIKEDNSVEVLGPFVYDGNDIEVTFNSLSPVGISADVININSRPFEKAVFKNSTVKVYPSDKENAEPKTITGLTSADIITLADGDACGYIMADGTTRYYIFGYSGSNAEAQFLNAGSMHSVDINDIEEYVESTPTPTPTPDPEQPKEVVEAYENLIKAPTLDDFDDMLDEYYDSGVVDSFTDAQWDEIGRIEDILCDMEDETEHWEEYSLTGAPSVQGAKLYLNPVTWPDEYVTINMDSMVASLAADEVMAEYAAVEGEYTAENGDVYYIIDTSAWAGFIGKIPYKYIHKDNFIFSNQWQRVNGKAKFATDSAKVYDNSLSTYYQMSNSTDLPVFDVYYSFLQNVDGIDTLWYVVDSTGWTDTYGNTVRGKFVKAADVNLITEEAINTAYNDMLTAATVNEFDSLYSAAQTNGIIDCLTDAQKQALAGTRATLVGMQQATTDLSQYNLEATFANEETKLYPNPVTQPDKYITAVVKEEQSLLSRIFSSFSLFLTVYAAEEEVTAQEIIIIGKYLADDGTLYYILDVSGWEGLDGIETIYVKASEIDIKVDEATQTTFVDLLTAQSGEELAEMLADLDDNTVAVMTEAGLIDLAESHAEVIEFLAENGSAPITDESVIGMYGQPVEGSTTVYLYADPDEATAGQTYYNLPSEEFITPFKIIAVKVDIFNDVVYYQMNNSYAPMVGNKECSWIRADAVEILEDYVDPTEALYLKLMQTETLEEWNAVLDSVTEEQWTTINFSAEQQTALDEHLANLPTALEKEYSETTTELLKAETVAAYMELVANVSEEVDAMILADSEMEDRLIAHIDALVAAEDTSPKNVTNYTNAAPLGEPVVGAAPVTTYSLLQRRSLPMLLADDIAEPEEKLTQVDGVVTDKKVALSTENAGYYTVTLETYVTGEKVTQRIEKHIPTDIIVVVDQSGSMADSMINEVQYENYKTKIPNITASQIYGNYNNYQTRNNTYVKVGDKYVKVEIVREVASSTTTSEYTKIDDGTRNNVYYSTYGEKGTLYYYLNNEYVKVYVKREQTNNWWEYEDEYRYTYTAEDGTVIYTSDNNAENDRVEINKQRLQFYKITTTTVDTYAYKFTYTGADGTPVTHTYNADDVIPTGSESPAVSGGAYYYRTVVSTQPRLTALTNALTNFVKKVEEKTVGPDNIKGNTDDVNHRIAIVGFSSDGYSNTEVFTGKNVTITTGTEWQGNTAGNSKFYPTGYAKNGVQYAEEGEYGRTNYINATKTALVDVSSKSGDADSDGTYDGFENVNEAISALTAQGGTYTDDGTQMALDIWANDTYELAEGEQRNRVVVIFTDGTPGLYSNSFDYTIATNAIEDTKKMKAATTANGYGATVYTVGIFDDADGTINVTNGGKNAAIASDLDANEFMHYMSNNYKNADGFNTPNDPTFHQVKQGTEYLYSGKSFYLSAGDSDALNNIFETISEDVQNESKSYELDETTVVKDIVAQNFLVPTNADTNTIKVYTALTTGTRTPTADDPETFTFAAPVDVTTKVDVSINGKNVDIKGFDFAENWVGEIINNGVVTGYHGSKLIIEFDIPVDPKFIGGNKVKTNGNDSGVYVPVIGEDGNPTGKYTLVENFTRPTVDIPVKDIIATPNHQHIYRTNAADLTTLFTDVYVYDNGSGQVQDTVPKQIDGINNAYADITFTVKDGKGNVLGIYFIEAGNKFTQGVWSTWITETVDGEQVTSLVPIDSEKLTAERKAELEAALHPVLDEDTEYTIEWLVDGTNDDGVDPAETSNTSEGSVSAWVYIYNPTITFNDETVYYGGADTDITDNASTTITWDHNGTADTAMSANASKPSFDKFDFAYSYDTTAFVNGYTVKTGDIKVNVTEVTLNGTDITEDAKFAHGTCPESCTYADEDTEEFRVHVKTATLTISKKVTVEGMELTDEMKAEKFHFNVTQSTNLPAGKLPYYYYKVYNEGNNTPVLDSAMFAGAGQIALTHDQYVVITGMPIGTYTVTEASNTRYDTTATGGTFDKDTLTVTNAFTENPPLVVEGNVEFTNKLSTGYLEITKVIDMPKGFTASATDKFTIQVKQGDTVVKTVELTNGQTCDPIQLVQGTYTVVETVKGDLYGEHDSQNQTVTINAGQTTTATVTNPAKRGSFSVTKSVVGNAFNYTPDRTNEEFEMAVSVNGYTGGELSYKLNGDDTVHTTVNGKFKIKHGQVATFSDLLVGSTFTVKETQKSDIYTESVVSADEKDANATAYTIEEGKTEAITVTNTLKTGDIKIDKSVVMPDGFDIPEGTEFKFNVVDGKGATVTTVTLSATNSWTHTVQNLLVGSYTVKEVMTDVQKQLYTVYAETKDATVTVGSPANTVFTNIAKLGSLTIKKDVVDTAANEAANKDETFEMTVTISGVTNGTTLSYKVNEETRQATGNKITLKNGETAVFSNLPAGVTYAVDENLSTAQQAYYTAEVVDNGVDDVKGTIVGEKTSKVEVINTRKIANLKITKVVDGTPYSANDTFIFNVEGVGYTSQVIIKGNGSVTIKDLPLGEYTVTEDTVWSSKYSTTEPSKTVKLTATEDGVVTITNKPSNDKWLTDSAFAENIFADSKGQNSNAVTAEDATN